MTTDEAATASNAVRAPEGITAKLGQLLDTTGEPVAPADRVHFVRCTDCGQGIDRRDIRQFLHHAQPDHEPLRTFSKGEPSGNDQRRRG